MASGVCQECEPHQGAKRPERPCQECGKRTTAKSGKCRECENPSWMKREPEKYEHAVYAETPGRWVQRGLVWVWVPAKAPDKVA